jgi:hypothetical protein
MTPHLFTSRAASSLAALLLGLAAVGCGDSAEPNPQATLDLQGLVTDASSGDPISGASVQIMKCEEPLPLEQCTPKRLAEATTASDGRYHIIYTYTFLCDISPYEAPFWAEASASGHQPQSAGDLFETPLLCTAAEQALDFALPPQPAAIWFPH